MLPSCCLIVPAGCCIICLCPLVAPPSRTLIAVAGVAFPLLALPSCLELLTESVFFGRYQSVFLGIYHTHTNGKLGRYILVSKRGQLPPFFHKRGAMGPFLRSTAPLSRKKEGNDTKQGGTIPTKNTHIEGDKTEEGANPSGEGAAEAAEES